MYKEDDYLNFEDLNTIENRIGTLNSKLTNVTNIPIFSKKNWQLNEFPYIQEIDRIENAINNLGKYYYYPKAFITPKKWLNTGKEIKNFSYKDINRWIINLSLIEEIINDKSTIWNSLISYIEWNGNSETEWE